MSELQSRLNKLVLRLDRMGMRAEQAVIDAVHALQKGDIQAGLQVDENDRVIDAEEVEIEQECIRLLALYQPTAIDLRTICTIIKVNNDLERVADLAASIGRRVKDVVVNSCSLHDRPAFDTLTRDMLDILGRTVRLIPASDTDSAKRIIQFDQQVDRGYHNVVQSALSVEGGRPGGAERALVIINLAKAMERIGDMCTNIAEDIIFLRTGDVVRHSQALGEPH
jgi:phosphate transport system protein